MSSLLSSTIGIRGALPQWTSADVDQRKLFRLVLALFLCLFCFPLPEVLVTGGAQRIVLEETGGQPPVEESGAAWSAVMGSFILLLAVMMVISTYKVRNKENARGEILLRCLWLSYLVYCGIQVARGAATGAFDAALLKLLLPVIVVTMCFLARYQPYGRVYGAYRGFIWGYSSIVLITLVLLPRFVVMDGYKGVLPGISFRVHGFHHANQIAMLIAIYWVLKTPVDARHYGRWLTRFFDGGSLIVLLLTQSKATFLLLFVGQVVNVLLPVCRRSALTASLCAAAAVICSATLIIVKDDIDSVVTQNTDLATGSISTFSNRTVIWDMAIADWEQSPWFGYGANMWGQLARLKNGNWTAPHAHNQLLQTLWEVGIVGALALACNLAMLLWAAWRTDAGAGRGLFAATIMYIATGASEVPLPSSRCTSLLFLMYCFLFLAIGTSLTSEAAHKGAIAGRTMPAMTRRRQTRRLRPVGATAT